jgi:TolB-like protein
MKQFFDELKRRNVVRVGFAYLVVGWLVFQVGEVLFPTFGAPDWVFKSLILLIALGFPFALLFAWAFELTPEGIKKTEEVDASTSITPNTGKKLNYVTIAALVVALAYFIWERQSGHEVVDSSAEVAAVEQQTAEPVAAGAEGPGARTIAVLPFVNMSSDKEQEWFADGLTEEILNSLARTPDLLVSARTSSFAYKGSNKDITEIADALGVAHVLEGSVRRSSDRIRVTAQLIRAKDGFHLWSENYDRDFADLIDIQENVAFAIANALETAMDPEALARMVSAGTASIPAYEAYLHGLAAGISTLSTGDTYEFLNAQDAFERAIEIDPEFAEAHWRLANYWDIQLSETNIVSGITELTADEMRPRYDEAIDNAIRYTKDPADKLFARAAKALHELKFVQALRLNTEYLEHRPNDQRAQDQQLTLLATVGDDEGVLQAVEEFQERDGHDVIVVQNSMTRLAYVGGSEYTRKFSREAAARFPDQVFLQYQAHRALLSAGDIDGAAQLLPIILSSDMPESSRHLVLLRQACADNRVGDALRMYERGVDKFADDASIMWISHMIMGEEDAAKAVMMKFDEAGNMKGISDFLTYGTFDPRPFPNLMALLESQGIERGEPVKMSYQCKR